MFEIGVKTGGYEFLDVISSNPKTGITYKVRNVKFGRLEMLRILPMHLQGDPEKVERFLREVKVHARLSHPNIVTFYNAAEIEGQLVMTVELVEGSLLAGRLELGPIPVAEALEYVRHVLSALAYAHKQGVVHRDVTPANILITPDRRAMLTGFGMAKAATDPNLTQTGTAVGAAPYISPEQVKNVTTLDGRSDLYSAGIVLYEAVTGSLPFKASSQFEVMLAHVNNAPKPPRSLNPSLPEALDEIILKALAKEPKERYQTADDFSDALSGSGNALTESRPKVVSLPPGVSVEKAPARVPAIAASSRPVKIAAASAIEPLVIKPSINPSLGGVATANKALRSETWTWPEVILGGVLTSIAFTVVFLIFLVLMGKLPLGGH